VTTAAVPGIDDEAIVGELGEGGETVGEAEPVRRAKRLQRGGDVRADVVGRWVVVMADADLEHPFVIPATASDGIHEMLVTEPSIRIGNLLCSAQPRTWASTVPEAGGRRRPEAVIRRSR
jgi:hypothetical protein